MFEGFHNFDLISEGFIEFLGIFFNVGCGNSLHSYEISISDVSALINHSIRSFTDLIIDVDNEGLDEFVVWGA